MIPRCNFCLTLEKTLVTKIYWCKLAIVFWNCFINLDRGINIGKALHFKWSDIKEKTGVLDLFRALALGLCLTQFPHINIDRAFGDLVLPIFESRADCNCEVATATTECNG